MRKTIFLLSFWLTAVGNSTIAQPKAIGVEYNDFAFTRNLNITYHHSFLKNSFSIYGGLGYYLNNNLYLAKIVPTENGTIEERAAFYHLESTTLDVRIGIKFGIEKTIALPRNSYAFAFYDFQYYVPGISGGEYGRDPYGNIVAGGPIPIPWAATPDVYMQHVGFGLRAEVYKMINIKLLASMGVYKLDGRGQGFVWYGHENFPQGWQFSRMFGVGVEYAFNKRESKKKQ